MELLLLAAVAYVVSKRKASTPTPIALIKKTFVAVDPRKAELEAACRKAGLTASQCSALVAGKLDQLGDEALKRLCNEANVPGCELLGSALLGWLTSGLDVKNYRIRVQKVRGVLNDSLNGRCKRVLHEDATNHNASFISYAHSARVCGEYENGCRPFSKCVDFWGKCKPGTKSLNGTMPDGYIDFHPSVCSTERHCGYLGC